MSVLFKQLITDFHRGSIPEPSPRDLELPDLPPSVRKAFVFIGMRRSGKTWAMYQIMHQLIKNGLDPTKLLYINFEDDRLGGLEGKDLQGILDAYFELYPENVGAPDLHFFFDEIHEAPRWEKFIRRLLDSEKMQIYISGSSAKMLSKEIATNLRGRTIVREVFPFSFCESMRHQGKKIPENPSSKEKAAMTSYVKQFIRWGGFPETIGSPPALHRELLQGYVETVTYRDIIERYHVTNTAALKRLLTFCFQDAASLFSVNKIYNSLKSLGYSVGKNSLYQFMDYLEDAFCIFSIPRYHPSLKKTAQQPKKVYPVDPGLVTAYGWHEDFKHGARLESAVFSFLRRHHKKCFYYQTEAGREVDFLTITPDQQMHLFQVTLTLKDHETRERELIALRQAMLELNLNQGTIVTLDEEEALTFPEGIVSCTPAWKFLSQPL